MVYTGEMAAPQGGTDSPADVATPAARLDGQRRETLVIMEKRAAAMQQAWRESLQAKHTALEQKLLESQEAAEEDRVRANNSMEELGKELAAARLLADEAEASRVAAAAAAAEAKADADQRLVAAQAASELVLATARETAAARSKEGIEQAAQQLVAEKAEIVKAADARVAAAKATAQGDIASAKKQMAEEYATRVRMRREQDAARTDAALERFLKRVLEIANAIDTIAAQIDGDPKPERVRDLVDENKMVRAALDFRGDAAAKTQQVLSTVIPPRPLQLWGVNDGVAATGQELADRQEAQKQKKVIRKTPEEKPGPGETPSFPEGAYGEDGGFDGNEDEYIPSFGRPLLF